MRLLASLSAALVLASACSRQVQVGSGPEPSASHDPLITSADQLLETMRARYAGRWFRNTTFVQKSTYFRPDGSTSRVETWYEAAALPGRLRIDLGELAKENGILYRNDSLYQVQGGTIVDRRSGTNPLLVLAFDVYAQPVSRTFDQLRRLGFNLTMLRVDSLDGKRTYVIGAGPRDSTTNQFWIEEDRLLFVRMIQTDQRGRTQDIRFENYVQHGGGWIAELVRFFMEGRVFFLEEYSDVRVNVSLDENLFVPEKWSTATHWYSQ
ncbi:MAG: hypothetical protein ACREOK_06665 [Gemmatimonadaceae bacterium]